jgi:hypothetical protein
MDKITILLRLKLKSMKKYKYEVTIEIPECDSLEHGENYLQELIQDDLDIEDAVSRWKVEVKALEEEQ